MERPIRVPARTYYDRLEDYIYQINHFDYSSPSFDAFKAILNSDIEPQHLEQCILWYNSFDQTLHHRQAEWDIPFKRAREERYVIDTDKEAKRLAELEEALETHRINRELASRGNDQGPLTMEQRIKNRKQFLKMYHPEEHARNEAALELEKKKKPQTLFQKLFGRTGGKTRRKRILK
jgi:hypothetical protein